MGPYHLVSCLGTIDRQKDRQLSMLVKDATERFGDQNRIMEREHEKELKVSDVLSAAVGRPVGRSFWWQMFDRTH
jgi:hypothetical protein